MNNSAAHATLKWAALAVGVAMLPGAAQAQQASITEARAAFDEGEAAYAAEDYTRALERYQRSYSLMQGHPNQGMILYNIARSEDNLSQYVEALATYRRFLVDAPDDTPLRGRARQRIVELEVLIAADRSDSGGSAQTEGSVANWLIAGGLAALAVPAIAIPAWAVATEGECTELDSLGCQERVQVGAVEGVLFGLGGLALVGAIVFAAAQPIQVEVQAGAERATVRVRGRF